MTGRKILTAPEVDAQLLDSFLTRFYSPEKARFLREHGDWWYRGAENRWVILEGSDIAGYCGVIPGRLVSRTDAIDTLWWVDLVVAPEFRRRGLQRDFDEEVKSRTELIVGFPNALAADIHRRHGWGVQENLRTLLMPLRPGRIGALRRMGGLRSTGLRVASMAMEPIARLFRWRLERWSPRVAVRIDPADAIELDEFCSQTSAIDGYTTDRDRQYLQWRYWDAPYVGELSFFRTGEAYGPQVMAITRTRQLEDRKVMRVLDIFGAIGNRLALRHIVLAIGQEAVRQGAVQVTVMTSNHWARSTLRSLGFIVGKMARFCWWSSDPSWKSRLDRNDNYWVLADSDNDEP